MIRLPSVFSSGALFQQNSTLLFRGTSNGFSVTVRLMLEERVIAETTAAVSDGRFEAELPTPAASLNEYSLRFFDGEVLLLEHILFGELWLASGQSNMQFTNSTMSDCDAYLDTLAGLPVRIFVQDYPEGGNEAQFPRHPSDALGGKWCGMDNRALLHKASAVGTAFLKELTHYFRDRIPVGILNSAWGGTAMRSWLPEKAVLADPYLSAKFEEYRMAPLEEKWNGYAGENYHQAYCMYNCKIAPLRGLRLRGILWYQGETDTSVEFERTLYRQYLHCYYESYSKEFAADPLNFMMISSLLYPWAYGSSGETHVGRLNQTFIDTAVQEPRKFAFTPIGDLSPVWAFHLDNHPIHPAHKYEVGTRLALLAETNSYERGSQRTPATMLSCEKSGNTLIIRFKHASSGLQIHGSHIRGLYIAGEDNVYMAAKCKITAPDTLVVWHPYLRNPVHAAYAYSSFEECVNLFAGELPVAPFATDQKNVIRIECKPWLDLSRQSVWVNHATGDVRDVFYHPVWQPLPDSEVCVDPSFTKNGQSLRICSEEQEFGAFVKAYPFNRLDLQNYSALRMHIYNTGDLEAKLELSYDKADPVTVPIEKTASLGDGWDAYAVSFENLPAGEINKMTFRFAKRASLPIFVNIEELTLVPKC